MGTKISSEKSKEELMEQRERKQKQFVSGNIHQKDIDVYNPFSSYEGLKSNTSKDTTSSKYNSCVSPNNSRLTTSSNTDCADDPNEKIPTEFTWREGGSTVYVTGNFANWKQWFLMNKINTNSNNPQENIFHITLDLPRGTYHYKFIVDKVWKCSNDSPKIEDEHGNTNNIINNAEVCLLPRRKKTIKKIKIRHNASTLCKPLAIDLSSQYFQLIPRKYELNCDAPVVPGNYQKPYDINLQTQQTSIGNQNFLKGSKKINASSYSSYTSISKAPHVNLNLLCTDLNTNKKSGLMNIAITTRIKEKFVTYIYYKPIN